MSWSARSGSRGVLAASCVPFILSYARSTVLNCSSTFWSVKRMPALRSYLMMVRSPNCVSARKSRMFTQRRANDGWMSRTPGPWMMKTLAPPRWIRRFRVCAHAGTVGPAAARPVSRSSCSAAFWRKYDVMPVSPRADSPGRRARCAPVAGSGEACVRGEGGDGVGRRHGPREQVALDQLAVERAQDRELLGRFHAFGDHLELQVAGQVDDGAHDGRVLAPAADRAHEGAVDLDGVHLEAVQVRQGRVSGAEVVEVEPHADGAQPAQRVDGGF